MDCTTEFSVCKGILVIFRPKSAAITSDQTTPILVNGRICKSINKHYNRHKTKRESRKRYFRLENYFHHVSKFIVQHCLKHGIGTIIIGKNDGWKQGMKKLDKRTRTDFQNVPFWRLLEKVKYKAALAGLDVVFTEEAYTSKASFFDRDSLPEYVAGVKHEFSGTRMGRGRYRSSDGRVINDCNGSANIGRKVIRNEDIVLRLDKSLAARPVRVNPLRVFSV